MSTNNVASAQPQTVNSRLAWTQFSQSLCQLVQDKFFISNNAILCKSVLLERLRNVKRRFVFGGRRFLVRVVRAFERAPADAFIAIIDLDAATDVPANDCSDFELRKWATKKLSGVHFIPIDAKLTTLTIGRRVLDRQLHFYHWTRSMNDIDHVDDSEVIFTIIEGVEDHIAVIPTSTWVTAPYTLTYGLDTLNSRVPVWMSPFMVHNDQIAETVERLARVAISIDGNSDYICPTTGVRLEEWYPKSTTEPRVCAETPLAHLEASQERSIEFWDEVEEHGCEVHINPAQPGVHDFYVSHRATGWLRFEEKKAPSFFQMLDIAQSLDPRHDPLAAFRTWHVFYLHTPPGPVCITRDELEQLQGKRPSEEFVKDHTFNGFADAWQHILKHAEEAKRSVQRVLATLTPTDISVSLPKREMVLFEPKHDPLSAISGAQTTLSWLSRQINFQCFNARFGVCLPLGAGHPLGTHVFIAYKWETDDISQYSSHRRLPVSLWSPGAGLQSCVLRLQDHSPHANIEPLGHPLAVLKSHWVKPVKGRRSVIIGSRLPRQSHESGEKRNASYLVMPDGFTVLGSTNDFLQQPAGKETGVHFFRPTQRGDAIISDPEWGTGRSARACNDRYLTTDVNPLRYIINLADGTLIAQLRAFFTTDGMICIDNPLFPGSNKYFDPKPYVLSLQDVLQAGWDYGYAKGTWEAMVES